MRKQADPARQVQAPSSSKSGSGKAYGGVMNGLVRMWKEEGFAGFMKGNGINVVRVSTTRPQFLKLECNC
jgi:hypothetical protein